MTAAAEKKRLAVEVAIVITLTFGARGLRSVLELIRALMAPARLSEQSVTLHQQAADNPLLDIALQLVSSATLVAYGALALYLLGRVPRWRRGDGLWGVGLAALIGLPGLALYVAAVHFGWSNEVVPAQFDDAFWQVPVLLVAAAATAWAEELVVVRYLLTRLQQLGVSPVGALCASAVLRGSYHLYQGVSAGFGNVAMGLIFGYFYHRTERIWPLVAAHFVIDAVAFLGYALVF